jgi:hypothetical protein
VLFIIPEDDDSFTFQSTPGAAVVPHSFHEVILLTEGSDNSPADPLALSHQKNLVYPLLPIC